MFHEFLLAVGVSVGVVLGLVFILAVLLAVALLLEDPNSPDVFGTYR